MVKECLRDIGVEDDAFNLATTGDCIRAQRWCRSMADVEYGRVACWGGHADTKVGLR
jgi:hypothetical protein